MAGHLSKGLCAAAFLSITIVALGGCDHSRPTPQGVSPASGGATQASDEVSQASIGKQITIHGKFLMGKFGWRIELDNQQEVYFGPQELYRRSYHEMDGKLVTATGTLRFYERPKNAPLTDKEGRPIDRGSDYFYFEEKTTQLRLLPDQGAAK